MFNLKIRALESFHKRHHDSVLSGKFSRPRLNSIANDTILLSLTRIEFSHRLRRAFEFSHRGHVVTPTGLTELPIFQVDHWKHVWTTILMSSWVETEQLRSLANQVATQGKSGQAR